MHPSSPDRQFRAGCDGLLAPIAILHARPETTLGASCEADQHYPGEAWVLSSSN
jgi:hypothetical protein